MPRISTDNYDTVASWNGSQDLFVVEQPDGTKVATPAMVKQFIEAGDFEATGEVKDGHGNRLDAKQDTLTIVDISSQANIDTTQVMDFKAYTYGKLICIYLRLKPGVTDQTTVVSGLPSLIRSDNFLVLPMFHMNAVDATTDGACLYAGSQIQYRGSTTQGTNGTVYSGVFLLA